MKNKLERVKEIIHRPITDNERYWIDVIRLASDDRDPPPTLRQTQAFRCLFSALQPNYIAPAVIAAMDLLQGGGGGVDAIMRLHPGVGGWVGVDELERDLVLQAPGSTHAPMARGRSWISSRHSGGCISAAIRRSAGRSGSFRERPAEAMHRRCSLWRRRIASAADPRRCSHPLASGRGRPGRGCGCRG
ncbi:hypothetical protein EJC49_08130 [Aquibium carbonis]|uniref:Uncharacterized protein n=1 Tax=Aquibium carbonis TaxID=2495581 RepID=A0A3R9YTQ1_9HYPH|nr:hypothetical protein EJC49_08130 [Aquibium carbonis]